MYIKITPQDHVHNALGPVQICCWIVRSGNSPPHTIFQTCSSNRLNLWLTLLFFARRGSCGSLISVQINIKQCGPLSTCKSSVSALYSCTESSQSLCTQLKVATVIHGSSRLIGAVSNCVKAPCRLCVHTFSHYRAFERPYICSSVFKSTF